jgi:hypothetical protein
MINRIKNGALAALLTVPIILTIAAAPATAQSSGEPCPAERSGYGIWGNQTLLVCDGNTWNSVLRYDESGAAYFTGGNVGIGTDNPTAKLEIAGQVKITGGTPGAGKTLMSDADGLASWGAAPATDLAAVLAAGNDAGGASIVMGNGSLTGLAAPVANSDATNKEYVDTAVAANAGASFPICKMTNEEYNGNLGGVSGANEKCQLEFGPEWRFGIPNIKLLSGALQYGTVGWCAVNSSSCSNWTNGGGADYGARCLTSASAENIITTSGSTPCSAPNQLWCCNF